MEAPRQSTATAGTAVDNVNLAEGEAIEMQDRAPKNPFLTPYGSMPASAVASTTSFQKSAQSYRSSQRTPHQRRYFHSRRIVKGNLERPWLKNKDPREKWVNIIPICGIIVGILLSGFLIWDGLQTVQKHNYCSVYETDFSDGLDEDVWTKEVEVGGFGYVSVAAIAGIEPR